MTAIATNAITPTTIHTVDVEPSSPSASLVLVSSPSVVSPVAVDTGAVVAGSVVAGAAVVAGPVEAGPVEAGAAGAADVGAADVGAGGHGRRARVVDVDHGDDLVTARRVERHVVDGRGRLRPRRQDQQPRRGELGRRDHR